MTDKASNVFLIPTPKKLALKDGRFNISANTGISLDTPLSYRDYEAAKALHAEIEDRMGIKASISKSSSDCGTDLIRLRTEEFSDSALSYRLSVCDNKVEVIGNGSEGLYYGIQTLRQLIRENALSIPCLEIEDYPCFKNRGFYHDITRGKIPTLDTLKELADRLSFYKVNQLQLYIEHSFAFKNHSEIWIDSDPLTAEEIIILDEYCKTRNIELIPSLSTFGHLYHALMSKSYRHLNEFEEIPETPFMWYHRMGHYTLDVSNPQSLDFVYGMIDEYLPLFTSNKFNICCDETFDLGEGRNRAFAERFGKSRLYLDFSKKIIEHVKSYGKTVMMWGDILLKHPEAVNEVPKDVIILNWDYNPDVKEDGVRLLAEAGLEQYVCPGVHGWNKLMNDMDAANKNISALVQYGKKYNATGVLNTDWGDFGHINLLSSSIPGAIYGAGLSWCSDEPGKPTDEEISRLEYGDKTGRLVGLLRDLSRQRFLDWETLVVWYYNETGLDTGNYGYNDYHLQLILKSIEAEVKTAYNRIRELQKEISGLHASILESRKPDLVEFLIDAEGLALFQALLLIIKKRHGQEIKDLIYKPRELAEQLEYWYARYKAAWRARNKESELYRIKEVIMGICKLLR